MSKSKQHYVNLIIGFGKGGKTLAAYLANHGQQVALIERSDKMYGGTCINIACIPTKSLITSAEEKIPYEKAYKFKNDLTSFLRKQEFEKVDKLSLATVITGSASFISPTEVRVKLNQNNEEVVIQADRIFINTGTEPFIPSFSGIQSSKKVFTSTSIMEQSVLLKHLVIIGAGFVGLEFADMYAKFGAEVTVLDSGSSFLPKEDQDISDEIFKVMTSKGTRIITAATIETIADTNTDTVSVEYKNKINESQKLEASAILMATGRRPVTGDLNLAAAGVQTNKLGYVQVDEFLKTNVPHIWAIGDVNGGPQFTYISLDDFRIIRDQLFGGEYNSVKKRKPFASSVFITPQLSHIGLREKEAIEKGLSIKVARLSPGAVPKARILNNTEGLLKTVVDSKTNKILGCTLFCNDANEMINTIQTAMNAGLNYQQVRDTIYTHPSMTEAFNSLYSSV
jgi:probable pyridine nucleotide-disulfide oxidoreductase